MIDEFIGKTLAGKYKIEELLRESDLGSVYRGRHLLMDTPVAVKILAPDLAVDQEIVKRFSLEARTISRLSHPNILNVTDFGRDEDGSVFIVMEDAEGELLPEVIRSEGALSVERAVRIARQISAALSSMHANQMTHGALTSENVLLSSMGNDSELVKVFDIGTFSSADKEDYDGADGLRRLSYLSPEQCSGEAEIDERADIYSLGIIFYEMLVGEVPFSADNKTDLMLKHAQVPPPPFAAFRDDIPEAIEPIVIRALAKNPDMRYQNASAFAEDLAEAVRIEEDESTIVIPAARDTDANANNVWKTAFIVLAGVSLLAFGLIYWTNTNQTDPTTVRQFDEDGMPVQPLNPATGTNEQNLPPVSDYPGNSLDPNDPIVQPDVGGGGDGYDPWSRPGTPPGGSPSYQPYPPGGPTVTIKPDPNNPFNQDEQIFGYDKDGNPIILVPKKVPAAGPNTKAEKPGTNDTAKPNTDANTAKKPADKSKTPNANTTKKPDSNVKKPGAKKPADKKPAEKPKPKTPQPATKSQKQKSGVEQDT